MVSIYFVGNAHGAKTGHFLVALTFSLDRTWPRDSPGARWPLWSLFQNFVSCFFFTTICNDPRHALQGHQKIHTIKLCSSCH